MKKRGGVTINMVEILLKEEETKKVQAIILEEGVLLIIHLI
jgi:hypothetical protein